MQSKLFEANNRKVDDLWRWRMYFKINHFSFMDLSLACLLARLLAFRVAAAQRLVLSLDVRIKVRGEIHDFC